MLKLRTIFRGHKSVEQLNQQIDDTLKDEDTNILITGINIETFKGLTGACMSAERPSQYMESAEVTDLVYIESCQCAAWLRAELDNTNKSAAITSAGIADRNIVDEAGLTVLLRGYQANFFNDIGVNDLQKTLDNLDEIKKSQVIVSVQGFEGALPVVLAGLTDLPIISVPTSTGYGVSAKGYTALNTSLSSCTPGITAVNINNGFGAGESAARILNIIGEN